MKAPVIQLWHKSSGYAVVEATILFPIMIMIFAALVLLAMYLPTRATLQRATQYAATAIAIEGSDSWLFFDESSMSYYWEKDKRKLDNVYVSLLKSFSMKKIGDKAEIIVINTEGAALLAAVGDLSIEVSTVNYLIYQEVTITATRIIPVPVNLSFINFPQEIPITVSSTALIANGDEFVRNVDLAIDCFKYLDEKYHITSSGLFVKVKEIGNKINFFLGL